MKISNIVVPVISILMLVCAILYLIYSKMLITLTWNNWDTVISISAGVFIVVFSIKLGIDTIKG